MYAEVLLLRRAAETGPPLFSSALLGKLWWEVLRPMSLTSRAETALRSAVLLAVGCAFLLLVLALVLLLILLLKALL